MDQLTAYRILQLRPGSTRREIREAYARLAKEYHPEEHPKEFNEIQEAYQFLTGRGDGENWSFDAGDNWDSTEENMEEPTWTEETDVQSEDEQERADSYDMEQDPEDFEDEDEEEPEEVEDEEPEDTFASRKQTTEEYQDIRHWESRFDAFEKEDRRRQQKREAEARRRERDWQREQQRLREQMQQAIRDSLYELETILIDPKRRNRAELYEPFFFRSENRAVMQQEEYVNGLINLLEKYPLKKKIYLTLKKIYAGSGEQPVKVLGRYLDQKIGKGSQNPWGAAAFGAIATVQLQFCCGEEWKTSPGTMIGLLVLIVGLVILYAGLRIHYSIGISQIWIAGILFWLSLLALITTVSDNLFTDVDTGIAFAVIVWLESIIWMIVLGVRAIFLKIGSKNKR